MQHVGTLLDEALPARARGRVAGEGQGRNECGSACQRHSAPPLRGACCGEIRGIQGHGEQRRQRGSGEPHVAEVGVEQHRPDHVFGPHRRQRALAHLRRQQNEPGHAGDHGQGEAAPGNARQPPANQRDRGFSAGGGTQRRPRDERQKEHDARHRQCRCEMDGAHPDQRVIQALLLRSRLARTTRRL